MMTVADMMTGEPVTISETANLRAAEEMMRVARFRHLPVVRGARLIGILTHRDLLAASLSKLAEPDSDTHDALMERIDVSQVMVHDVVCVEPTTELAQAANTMIERKIDCLPVVEPDGRLVGILTATDFLKLCRSLLEMSRTPDVRELASDR